MGVVVIGQELFLEIAENVFLVFSKMAVMGISN